MRVEPAPSWATKVWETVKGLFAVNAGEQPVPGKDDLQGVTNLGEMSSAIAASSFWKIQNERKAVYRDINQMDADDEYVSTALDIIADCSVAYEDDAESTFHITSDDTEVQGILDDLLRRTNLKNEIWQVVRDFVKHGCDFREVLLNKEKNKILRLKQTVVYQIWPNLDDKGNKVAGWLSKTDDQIYSDTQGTKLEEWQIVPFLYGAKMGYLPVPLLASARRNWQRLQRMEDGMAIARLVRAYDKFVHKVPVKPENNMDAILETITRYKNAMTKRQMMGADGNISQQHSPLDVNTDFFLPDDGSKRGDVTMISSQNAQLGNLNDVYYHRERLVCRLKVPVSFLQISSAMKTHLRSQSGDTQIDIQFARTLRRVQVALKEGLQRVCDLELMLNGVAVKPGLYTIHLTPITTKNEMQDAEILNTKAQAALFVTQAFGMLPTELLADKFLDLNDRQQEILTKFMDSSNGKALDKAKLDKLKTEAKPAPAPAFGAKNQSVDELTEAFFAYHELLVSEIDELDGTEFTKEQVHQAIETVLSGL